MKQIDSTDIDFIVETYPDTAWPIPKIAEKLLISEQTVRNYAKKMQLKRTKAKRARTPKNDWETLYYARLSRLTYEESAEAAGMDVESAKYAMKRMLELTESQRILAWNKYRKAHGMPLFTKC